MRGCRCIKDLTAQCSQPFRCEQSGQTASSQVKLLVLRSKKPTNIGRDPITQQWLSSYSHQHLTASASSPSTLSFRAPRCLLARSSSSLHSRPPLPSHCSRLFNWGVFFILFLNSCLTSMCNGMVSTDLSYFPFPSY